MSKKLVGLLLALCLIVGLLPVTAMAADGTALLNLGSAKAKITGYDSPVYFKNASAEAKDTGENTFTYWYPVEGSATDWNAKFEWKSGEPGPTLTLNGFKIDDWNDETEKMRAMVDGAGNYVYNDDGDIKGMQTYGITTPKNMPMTIILTGEDSYLDCKFGITYYGNLTIKSEGDTKLTITGDSSGIASNNTLGASLTLDANLDVSIRQYYNSAFATAMIQTFGADLTINGGNINVDTPSTRNMFGISAAGASGDVIINGGTIKAVSACGTSAFNGVIHSVNGKVIVNGGDVTATPKYAVGLFGKKGIEINGGTVNIISVYYGINAGSVDEPADIVINGGTLEINAKNACYKPPKLGPNVTAFAGAGRDYAEAYDEADSNMCKRAWIIVSSEELDITTKPTEPPFVPVDPTQSIGVPTTAPTTAATQTPTGNDQTDNTGSDTILWIAVSAVVVIAGAAVAVILIKRKKA